jgi:hypothetical protein
MKAKSAGIATCALLGLWLAPGVFAAEPAEARLLGSIAGMVTNSAGTPQMGATVYLYNRYDRVVHRVLTDASGTFAFASLLPDSYKLKVTLASFLPAVKQNILVQPGMKSLLSVSLANVFSSIELIYTAPSQRAVMSDDWKWVLRSSSDTRPILRLDNGVKVQSRQTKAGGEAFTDTRGLVRLSAGDSGPAMFGDEADLGTAFALATSLFGKNQLEFSGNFGYSAASGMPATGFQTRFSRDMPGGTSPEVSVTMRQMFVPSRVGMGLITGAGPLPPLRTMSVSFSDKLRVGDALTLHYGSSMESIAFVERLNYFSPFARLTYELGNLGAFSFAYSSGLPPSELMLGPVGGEATDLQPNLASLGVFPRVSLRDGQARVQRTRTFEIGYNKKFRSRAVQVSAFDEGVSNAAITLSSDAGVVGGDDLLPSLFANTSVLNGGRYRSLGMMTSVSQNFGENLSLALSFGNSGTLSAGATELVTNDLGDLRASLRRTRRNWASTRVSGKAPATGTLFQAEYQWADVPAVVPSHVFLTQQIRPDPGMNLFVRQPVPMFPGLGGRLELTADLRNLLAQGYVPVTLANGRRVYLMQAPRSVRGGVSFIF